MKISKSELKKLVKEEIQRLNEANLEKVQIRQDSKVC